MIENAELALIIGIAIGFLLTIECGLIIFSYWSLKKFIKAGLVENE